MKRIIFLVVMTIVFCYQSEAQYTQTGVMDLNFTETAMFQTGWHPENRPSMNYGSGLSFKFWDTRYSGQILMPCLGLNSELYLRGSYNGEWSSWKRIWHSANVDELNVTELNLANYWQVNNGEVNFSGNVGIGTSSPDYKLDVVGTIRAQELKVDMEGADFVFEDNYKLRSLNEVESFIKENKHLPEIAPAADMQANGVNQSEMNQKLLQKIEELTLYVIGQNKQIQEQAELIVKNEKDKKELLDLRLRMKLIENQLLK